MGVRGYGKRWEWEESSASWLEVPPKILDSAARICQVVAPLCWAVEDRNGNEILKKFFSQHNQLNAIIGIKQRLLSVAAFITLVKESNTKIMIA